VCVVRPAGRRRRRRHACPHSVSPHPHLPIAYPRRPSCVSRRRGGCCPPDQLLPHSSLCKSTRKFDLLFFTFFPSRLLCSLRGGARPAGRLLQLLQLPAPLHGHRPGCHLARRVRGRDLRRGQPLRARVAALPGTGRGCLRCVFFCFLSHFKFSFVTYGGASGSALHPGVLRSAPQARGAAGVLRRFEGESRRVRGSHRAAHGTAGGLHSILAVTCVYLSATTAISRRSKVLHISLTFL
jgi:hypothetical protein